MIEKLRLNNFRNFPEREFLFETKNYISWKNGAGKTNILEALSLFSEPLVDIDYSSLVTQNEWNLYIELTLSGGMVLGISYQKESKQKKYFINGKPTTKKKLKSIAPSIVSFHPLGMNVMYLGPSKRRELLDSILSESFSEYDSILKAYKKILGSRNKLLKNISEGKSQASEIDFWDTQFLASAIQIYDYRKMLIDFLNSKIETLLPYFSGKITNIKLNYITKVDLQNPWRDIREYLKKNLQRDILLKKTHIGPHIDDFEIVLDDTHSLIDFASRWEVKSVVIGIKFLESDFRKNTTHKTPVFLIDDLLSELDEKHKDMIFKNTWNSQIFITSIQSLSYEWNMIKI